MSGILLAFEPGRGRTAVPVRAAIAGMAAALAAALAALVFGSSVSHVIADPAVAGWDWNVTVGNPHSGDVVAWQATALAGAGLIVGVPPGLLAGRWAWIVFAGQVAIVPAPVISPLTLLAIPAVLLLANAIAAIPAQAAGRTKPAEVLRTE